MNGIDTSAAALLANRLDALLPVGAQPNAGATQSGIAALAGNVATPADASGAPPQQQASAQTVLSAVALALDSIVRSGGDATPAVVGAAPVWPDPQAAQASAELAVLGLLDALAEALPGASAGALPDAAGANAAPRAGAGPQTPDGAPATAGSGGAASTAAAGAATPAAIAALAASLQRTVSGSGLFYESHLAQWLLGQRSPAELAAEPQNRLVASAAAQLPLDWRRGAGDADDVFWTDPRDPAARPPADGGAAPARAANPAQSALFDDDWLGAPSAASASADAAQPSTSAPGQPVSVHPAVLPLLRQQLDVLATGEFRWTGDAWPGVRLDWSIRQDGDDARRSHGAPEPDAVPWRTRLTLSLPSLGVVDAELTLVGAALAVRVQANAAGAARLAAHGDALRGGLAAAGIELGGLSIHEVGGAAPASGAAAFAAGAYARAAGGAEFGTAAAGARPEAEPGFAAESGIALDGASDGVSSRATDDPQAPR